MGAERICPHMVCRCHYDFLQAMSRYKAALLRAGVSAQAFQHGVVGAAGRLAMLGRPLCGWVENCPESIGSIGGGATDHSSGTWMFIFFNKCTYAFNTHFCVHNIISQIK